MGIFPTVRRENKKIFELPPPRKGVGQCCCWRMFFHWICQASRKDEWLETGSISRDSCDSDVTQDVNSVQIYSSTNQNLKNPWNFLGFLLFMTTIFIPSSYHPKFLIIGLKNGCKTPGSWCGVFFSPLGMPGHYRPSQSWNARPLLRRIWSLHGAGVQDRLLAILYMMFFGMFWDAILILDAWLKGGKHQEIAATQGSKNTNDSLSVVHTLKTRSFGWRCRPKTKTSEGKVGCCQKSANASVFCRWMFKSWN